MGNSLRDQYRASTQRMLLEVPCSPLRADVAEPAAQSGSWTPPPISRFDTVDGYWRNVCRLLWRNNPTTQQNSDTY